MVASGADNMASETQAVASVQKSTDRYSPVDLMGDKGEAMPIKEGS